MFVIVSRGAYLTAYTNIPCGMKVWVARRSAASYEYVRKFDTTVASGVLATETPFVDIVHEADEEVSLTADLVRHGVRADVSLIHMSMSSKIRVSLSRILFIFSTSKFPET